MSKEGCPLSLVCLMALRMLEDGPLPVRQADLVQETGRDVFRCPSVRPPRRLVG